MNKTLKTGLIIIAVLLVALIGYFLTISIIKANQNKGLEDISDNFQGEIGGCGEILVYRTNNNDDMAISVEAVKNKLGLTSRRKKSFSVEKTSSLAALKVSLFTGENIKENMQLIICGDVEDPNKEPRILLVGKTGTVSIILSDVDATTPFEARSYKATVTLKDIYFVDENGN